MDLNRITETLTPATRAALPAPAPDSAFLAGGTWLFSEPQPQLTRLVDLTALGWPPLTITPSGLEIAATCPIATLAAFESPADWRAAPLFAQCCRALLGSFKIWNMATIGGNLCLALPAGPMTALACALDGMCLIWPPDETQRQLPALEFVRGPQQNALAPGEILRSITLPLAALTARTAFRQISLSPQGRSGALLIGAATATGFTLIITAATTRPIRLAFPPQPAAANLQARLSTLPDTLYFDDVHGSPAWRRHVTRILAEEIRQELTA